VHLDRRLKLWEILEKAFGGIDRFKTRDELLNEELEKFVSIHRPDASHISRIRDFFKAYITDSEIRDIIEDKEYNRLATNPKVTIADLKALGRVAGCNTRICKGLCFPEHISVNRIEVFPVVEMKYF